MKKIKYFLPLFLLFPLIFGGCSGRIYEEKQSTLFIQTQYNSANLQSLIPEVIEHATLYNENLILGGISILYKDEDILINKDEDILINFYFSQDIDEDKAAQLSVTYSELSHEIVSSDYLVATKDIVTPFESALLFSDWLITVDSGYEQLVEKAGTDVISKANSIICYCNKNQWIYRIDNDGKYSYITVKSK